MEYPPTNCNNIGGYIYDFYPDNDLFTFPVNGK